MNCNCRNKSECPIRGECLSTSIIYEATVEADNNSKKTYIGLSGGKFKDRYYNHKKSFSHKKYKKETELSKHVWELKDSNINFNITWAIISQTDKLKRKSGNCNLCMNEKLAILMARKENANNCLNKRTELVTNCRHGYKPQSNVKKK